VQDALWVHLQLTGHPYSYNFAHLEEALNYQYDYGKRGDIFEQASRVMRGFERLAPMETVNTALGIAVGIGFLQLNGYQATFAASRLKKFSDTVISGATPVKTVRENFEAAKHHHIGTVKDALSTVLSQFNAGLSAIAKVEIIGAAR
jgi:prophage maintenance system killer protein